MKRAISMLLVVLMLVAMVACGGAEESKAPESQAPASTAPESQAPASTAPEAEAWKPEKPLTVIVPAGAGGDTDLNFRIFAKYLQEEIGQTVVVTNIKGTTVAMEEFKKAAPDGNTAYVHHPGLMVGTILGTIPAAYTDFKSPGIYAIDKQSAWFIGKDAEYKNLDELAEISKQRPVSFATEVGSMSHLTELMFMNQVEGSQINIVDAGGSADKITALMGGQLDLMFNQVGLVKDYLANGDFICLGVMSDERSPFNPDIPTFAEQGYDITLDKPYWMMFPAETDDAVIEFYKEAFQTLFANEELAAELGETMQTVPGNMTQEESMAFLKDINDTYAELLAGMQG